MSTPQTRKMKSLQGERCRPFPVTVIVIDADTILQEVYQLLQIVVTNGIGQLVIPGLCVRKGPKLNQSAEKEDGQRSGFRHQNALPHHLSL